LRSLRAMAPKKFNQQDTWFAKTYNAQGRGYARDYDLTKMPSAIFLNTKKYPSVGYRANIADMNNAILNEVRVDNTLDESRWKNNGYQGHVQYVTYFGKKPIFPKTVSRDLQMDTFPMEMSRALNTSQVGIHGKNAIKARPTVEEEDRLRESQVWARSSMSNVTQSMESLNKTQPHHNFCHTVKNVEHRDAIMGTELPTAYKNLRPAGLSSINPAMGTAGSLPDLKQYEAGTARLDAWRKVTPWAYAGLDD
jgi:hypothetical protein